MKIGMVGLGKLGYPVAQAIQSKGHSVIGCDPRIEHEPTWMTDIGGVVRFSDIVFVAVQTPHQPQYEGITRLPDTRADFDYGYLVKAVSEISTIAQKRKKKTELVIISTVLPGTIERQIMPLTNKYVKLSYNPAFIAMGTVIEDFLHPEFVLLGGASRAVEDFYKTITDAPILKTSIVTAECIKVAYNTFLTAKIGVANLWGEIAHKVGANFDDIFLSWELATNRLISSKYLRAGMGDGGGCHPRDNIALSWFAGQIDLSHNLFDDLMEAREDHAEWLADMIPDEAVIFGTAFKPESDITTGSPALLLTNILREQGKIFIQGEDPIPGDFNFIATKHNRYKDIVWPEGCTVVDPFRYLPRQRGVKLIRIGGKNA